MIIEEQLRQILEDGGFLGTFTDYFGNSQPAPKVQIISANQTLMSNNPSSRYIAIIVEGDAVTAMYAERQMIGVHLFGLPDISDQAIVKHRADQMLEHFLQVRKKDNIIDCIPQGFSIPPMFTETGRPVCSISLIVPIDRGIIY